MNKHKEKQAEGQNPEHKQAKQLMQNASIFSERLRREEGLRDDSVHTVFATQEQVPDTSEPQNFVIPVLARRQVTPRVSSLAAQSSKISERLGSVRDLASKIRQRMTEGHT